MKEKSVSEKKHHYMIAGKIVFNQKDQPERINSIDLNGILIIDQPYINVASIGKAQQILQMHFHKNVGDASLVNVLDVVVLQFSHLGLMTQQEFEAVPAGMKLQEKAPVTPDLDDAIRSAKPAND